MSSDKSLSGNRWFILACLFAAGTITLNGLALISRLFGRETAETVVFFPGNGGTVEKDDALAWVFSFAAEPLADPGLNPVEFKPPVEGEFRWDQENILSFLPDRPWPAGGEWEAGFRRDFLLRAGLRRTAGTFSFGGEPLQLLDAAQRAVSEENRAELELSFNAPVSAAQLSGYLDIQLPRGDRLGWSPLPPEAGKNIFIRTSPVPAGVKELTLLIRPGLSPAEGRQRLKEPIERSVKLCSGLEVSSLQPYCSLAGASIVIRFSQQVDPVRVKSYLSTDPPLEVSVEGHSWYSSQVAVRGGFRPGGIYTLTLGPGLTAENGSRLEDEIVIPVCFPDLSPQAHFCDPGRYLSTQGSRRLEVETVNLEHFFLEAERVYPNNLAELVHQGLGYSWWRKPGEDICAPPRRRRFSASPARNAVNRLWVGLDEVVGEEAKGVFILSLGEEDGPSYREDRRLVILSDIGLSAHILPGQALVRAASLRTGSPLPETKITVLNKPNQVLAEGRTETDGCALLEWNRSEEDDPLLILAETADDLVYLPLEGTQIGDGRSRQGAPFPGEPAQAFLYTDRGVYRPGETVRIRAILRRSDYSLPPACPVQMRVSAPDGKPFREQGGMTEEWGTAEFALPLPEYAAAGRYPVALCLPGSETVLGEGYVLVADFFPPTIEVKAVPRPESGEEASFLVTASYLYGAPAAGNQARGVISFSPRDFKPAGWEQWHFGDGEKEYVPPAGCEFCLDLNGAGETVIGAEIPSGVRPPAALRALLTVSVIEESGRAVTTEAELGIDPYPIYLGVHGIDPGETARGKRKIDLAAVRPDGGIDRARRRLQAVLKRISWSTMLKKNEDETYSYVSTRQLSSPLFEENVELDSGTGSITISPPGWGRYLLTVRDPDSGASTSVTFRGAGLESSDGSEPMEHPERVEVTALEAPGRPGTTATLDIRAPFPGNGLLEYETGRVAGWRTFTMEGTAALIDVPLDDNCLPGIHCTVSVFRPLPADGVAVPTRAVGSVYLPVIPAHARIVPAITGPETCRPETPVRFEVSLTDEEGKPVGGEVVLAAVDEGILSLTSFDTPDPFLFFSSVRRAEGKLHDIYSLILPDLDLEVRPEASSPGGDADGEELSGRLSPVRADRFHPVSLWSGPLPATPDEKATWTFTVPDFTGSLRVMAIAAGAGTGAAAKNLTVRSPLVISDSLPRFMAPGDRCRPRFSVRNICAGDGTLFFKAEASGSLREESWTFSTELATGQQTEFTVPLRAEDLPGEGVVSIRAELDKEEASRLFRLPVRPGCPRISEEYLAAIPPGQCEQIPLPGEHLAGTARLKIVCSPRPENTLVPGLDFLLNYPYGCLEQTTSAAFPLLVLDDLVAGSAAEGKGAGLIEQAIRKIMSRQRRDGSFSYWPESEQPCEWASLYAIHFLVEARQAGYPVQASRLEAALDWCRSLLRKDFGGEISREGWAEQAYLRSYACLDLALGGRADEGEIRRLLEIEERLPPGARINLAAAAAAARVEPQNLPARLAQLEKLVDTEPGTGADILRGTGRNRAGLLLALLSADPESPAIPRLVRAIQASVCNGRWGHTADTSAALLGLGRYFRTQAGLPRDYRAALSEDGEDASFSSQSSFVCEWSGKLPSRPALRNFGPGPLYLQARSSYIPTAGAPPEADRGLAVRRTFFYPDGTEADLSRLRKGEFLVAEITVDPLGGRVDHLVIEDLLPGGMEIENPNLETTRRIRGHEWRADLPAPRVEMKDDRLILFTGSFAGRKTFYYGVRVLVPGDYLLPPVRAEGMYNPEFFSVHGAGRIRVET